MGALVSVLLPAYGDADVLERSLPRLLERSRSELEVAVLNNDATQLERVRRLVEHLGHDRVRLHELEHGAGYCRAINAGIASTTGEIVFFMNSDLFVADGYVDTLAHFLEGHRRAACATGKILRYDLADDLETHVIDTAGLAIRRSRRVVDRGENDVDRGQFEREEEVFGVSGAALVARREALESVAVGGEYMDESFGMYKEDVDLSWRLRLRGWECWYVPSAVAYHARTSRGLASTAYLRGLRAFHENEKRKPRHVRINSMKNQWLMLVKNDDLSNVTRDILSVVGREVLVLTHNLVFAPRDTATAISRFLDALPSTIAKRRQIKASRRTAPSQIRSWLSGDWPSSES